MPTKHQKKLFSQKEMDDINDAISKQAANFPSGFSAGLTMQTPPPAAWNSRSSNYTTSVSPSGSNGHVVTLSMEDLEAYDMERVRDAIESMMDSLYPPFEPEIVHAVDKDYFLPALKVLVYTDGEYFSPQQQNKWTNMELEATCAPSPWNFGSPKTAINAKTGETELIFETPKPHSAPKEDCDCGIYGSVNLEEVRAYLTEGVPVQMQRHVAQLQAKNYWVADYLDSPESPEPIIRRKLCIIEPSPGAKVIMCRKGWKASGAFISEIVGETISPEEASNLLSIAWHRKIDIRRLKETT